MGCERVPGLKNTPSIVALLAAVALFVLTLAVIVRPSDANPLELATIAVGWVAVLASAFVARGWPLPVDEHARPPEPAVPAPDAAGLPHKSGVLLEFARELHATLESDRLRLLISRQLPVIVGRRDVWVVARFGSRQQIIIPGAPGERAELTVLSDHARQWATYPMKTDGQTIGILGAGIPAGGISPTEHRLFESVAGMVGQALSTANAFETMRKSSLIDGLTGCAMRAEGLRRFRAELRRADRLGTSLAVLMLDLDHFKHVNDRFGHHTGDAVLSAVGQTLLRSLRASDVRCRWGGEEFLLVLPDSSLERARRTSDKLRQRIAETPIRAGDHVLHVTASIGITMTRPGERDLQQCLMRADRAMYQAKNLGRNRTSVVTEASAVDAGRSADPRPPHGERREARDPAPPAAGHWTGPERRDATRPDRRRFPGPGRRASDRLSFADPERVV